MLIELRWVEVGEQRVDEVQGKHGAQHAQRQVINALLLGKTPSGCRALLEPAAMHKAVQQETSTLQNR
jgi:hypothetical protein